MPTHNRLQRVIGDSGHSGHELDYIIRTASTVVPPSASSSSSTPPTNSRRSPEPPLPSSSSCSSSSSSSSSATPTAPVVAPATHINTAHNPDTSSTINTTTIDTRGEDQDCTCPHCDRTFTSHIGLIGHLRVQCLGHQPTLAAPASTANTALPISRITWACSAACAPTRAELTAVSIYPPHPTHPLRLAPASLCRSVHSPPPPPPSPPPP
nr:unnamed protein product [Spirometra erinaceieuropaei]